MLRNIFDRLLEAYLKLQLSKSVFFQKETKFLGHVVTENGVATNPDKISAVRNWPQLTTAKQT